MGLLGDFLPKDESSSRVQIKEIAPGASDFTATDVKINEIAPGATPTSTSFLSSFSNFDLASAATKITEGASKMLSSFGSLANFKNLANGLPSANLSALLAQQGIGMGKGQALSDYTETAAARSNNDDVVVLLESTISDDFVRFSVSPRIGESRHATYSEINLIHHPGGILKYDRTSARAWSISARFVSRTPAEASVNQADLNIIRSWVMPFYGEGTEIDDPSKLGAPPPVLKISGYGVKNISPIPVVLESYSTNWPNDVDYINTLEGEPFPVIMDIELTLKESYSPAEYSRFNLAGYKSGILPFAFLGISAKELASAKARSANEKTSTSEPSILGNTAAMKGVPTASDLSSAVADQSSGFDQPKQKFSNIGSFETADASGSPTGDLPINDPSSGKQSFSNIGSF